MLIDVIHSADLPALTARRRPRAPCCEKSRGERKDDWSFAVVLLVGLCYVHCSDLHCLLDSTLTHAGASSDYMENDETSDVTSDDI
jgi:hypothetical protein